MGMEIERKFLVNKEDYEGMMNFFNECENSYPIYDGILNNKKITIRPHYSYCSHSLYRQGYVCNTDNNVRVRTSENRGYLTIKGKNIKISRAEYEYEIPFEDAEYMLNNLCYNYLIEKIRYTFFYKGNIWVADKFLDNNDGLVLAEIELTFEDQIFKKPDWVGEEVSGDTKYSGRNLSLKPFIQW